MMRITRPLTTAETVRLKLLLRECRQRQTQRWRWLRPTLTWFLFYVVAGGLAYSIPEWRAFLVGALFVSLPVLWTYVENRQTDRRQRAKAMTEIPRLLALGEAEVSTYRATRVLVTSYLDDFHVYIYELDDGRCYLHLDAEERYAMAYAFSDLTLYHHPDAAFYFGTPLLVEGISIPVVNLNVEEHTDAALEVMTKEGLLEGDLDAFLEQLAT